MVCSSPTRDRSARVLLPRGGTTTVLGSNWMLILDALEVVYDSSSSTNHISPPRDDYRCFPSLALPLLAALALLSALHPCVVVRCQSRRRGHSWVATSLPQTPMAVICLFNAYIACDILREARVGDGCLASLVPRGIRHLPVGLGAIRIFVK